MDYIRIYDTNCAMFLYPAYLQIVTQKKWHTLCHMFLDHLQKSLKDIRIRLIHLLNHKKNT